jgi:hypothetical protein
MKLVRPRCVSQTRADRVTVDTEIDVIGLFKRFLAIGTDRFELSTPCSQSRCATRLRHVPSGRQCT